MPDTRSIDQFVYPTTLLRSNGKDTSSHAKQRVPFRPRAERTTTLSVSRLFAFFLLVSNLSGDAVVPREKEIRILYNSYLLFVLSHSRRASNFGKRGPIETTTLRESASLSTRKTRLDDEKQQREKKEE